MPDTLVDQIERDIAAGNENAFNQKPNHGYIPGAEN
jgi:hypothetical protein